MSNVESNIGSSSSSSKEKEKDDVAGVNSKYRAISIQRKIIVGSISLIMFLTITAAIIITEMSKIDESAGSVINNRQPIAVRLLRFSDNINLATTFLNGYLLTGHKDHQSNFINLSESLDIELSKLSELSLSENSIIDIQKIEEFKEYMNVFLSQANNLISLRNNVLENYPGLGLSSQNLMPQATSYLSSANALMDEMSDLPSSEKNYRILVLLSEIRFSWQQVMNTFRLFLNSRVEENIANIELYLQLNKEQFDEFKSLAANIGFGEIEDMEKNSQEWRNNYREVVDLYLSDQWRSDAYLMRTEVRPLVEKLRGILSELSNTQVDASKQDGNDLTKSLANIRAYSGGLLLVSLILCIAIAIAVSRAVIPPIRGLMKAAQRVASGNLNTEVPVIRMDEVGDLTASFNKMVKDLKEAEAANKSHMQEIEQWNIDLEKRVEEKVGELKSTQGQLLQSEKLASIGQLAAGVAHEINNPVGYINSNVGTLKKYIDDLFKVLNAYEQLEKAIETKSMLDNVNEIKNEVELDYLKEDITDLIAESQEGVTRVKQIVQDLKDFSHVDEAEWQWVDLHKGIDSTLNVARNEIKYKAEVVKEYGSIPQVECIPSQLNQVFMNLVVNAAHAIEDRGLITIRSGKDDDKVWISVTDTGKGIPDDVKKRIFEPFFTTKPVGKGTGLGLSLSFGIIEKHGGEVVVESEVGVGTTFKVILPIEQSNNEEGKPDQAVGSAA